MTSGTAQARAVSSLTHYVQARLAEASGQGDAALNNYGAALTAAPQNIRVARRAYRQALDAGDFPLALRAARTLDSLNSLAVDGDILLYLNALHNRDWSEANNRLQHIADKPNFSFIASLLGDWLVLVKRNYSDTSGSLKPNGYRTESQALLALVDGRTTDGLDVIKTLWSTDPYRQKSLRITAAATLARKKLGTQGAALLTASDESAIRAKALVGMNKTGNLATDTPARGAAFILARLSGDLIVEGSSASGLTLARLAQYAAPENPRIQLNVAGALSAANRHEAALSISTKLMADPVYGDDAASFRIEQLEALDRNADALVEAQKRSQRSINDAARVADIQVRNGEYVLAAQLYQALLKHSSSSTTTQLAAANALARSGDWTGARLLLEPIILAEPDNVSAQIALAEALKATNDDLARAEKMASRALILRPDDPAIFTLIGTIALQRGRKNEAIMMLEQAVRLDDGNASQHEALGDAYWTAGRRIEARYAWTAAKIYAPQANLDRLSAKIANGAP